VRRLAISIVCLSALLMLASFAPASASAHLPPSGKCAPVEVVGLGGMGPATHIETHNVSCRRARSLIRTWLLHRTALPQDQTGWFCANSTGDPDTHGRLLCSFGNGRGAPYFLFRLSPAPAAAQGDLFYGTILHVPTGNELQRDPLAHFTFSPCNWASPRARCPAQVTVNDLKTDGWAVMVELWIGGKLRHVCWDTHSAASPDQGICHFRIPKGQGVTFFVAEGDLPVWKKCWHRVRKVWRRTRHLICGQPIHGNGKRVDYWAGPGRTGPTPSGWEQGPWGDGTFWGRA
jgi:hypothetical protein